MSMYICLQNIRSLYNVGSIIRTCSFFGLKNLILLGYSGVEVLPNGQKLLHPKVLKTSLGSEHDLSIQFLETDTDLLNFATQNKFKIISIEQNPKAQNFFTWQPSTNQSAIYVLGNEKDGVSTAILEASEKIIEIPKIGQHNSLNVEVTAGILCQKLAQNEHQESAQIMGTNK